MSAKQKTIVGLFVGGGFLLFALGLFWIGDRRLLFSESLELETRFANLSALKVGSKVMVSGMDAGEVLAVQVPPSPTRSSASVSECYRGFSRCWYRFHRLHSGRRARRQQSAPGRRGSKQGAQVTPGAILPSREPVEMRRSSSSR